MFNLRFLFEILKTVSASKRARTSRAYPYAALRHSGPLKPPWGRGDG